VNRAPPYSERFCLCCVSNKFEWFTCMGKVIHSFQVYSARAFTRSIGYPSGSTFGGKDSLVRRLSQFDFAKVWVLGEKFVLFTEGNDNDDTNNGPVKQQCVFAWKRLVGLGRVAMRKTKTQCKSSGRVWHNQ